VTKGKDQGHETTLESIEDVSPLSSPSSQRGNSEATISLSPVTVKYQHLIVHSCNFCKDLPLSFVYLSIMSPSLP
jgi:hypothetical protein